ncbi:MAG: sugar transferase [Cyanobacteriota bacterium]|nr:sugar transferase [Cyanobacteriota bacterium]
MALTLPWLVNRRRLLLAGFLDMVIVTVLFVLLHLWRFGVLPGFSLPMTWLLELWILLSYVAGRYTQPSPGAPFAPLAALGGTAVVTVLSGLLYLAYNWFVAQTLGQLDTRSFLLPLLAWIALLSYLTQTLLDRALAFRHREPLRWLLLGPQQRAAELRQWSQLRPTQVPLEILAADHLDLEQLSAVDGVMVDQPELISTLEKAALVDAMGRGLPVLSPSSWCEAFLQRLPPELIRDNDLLHGQFVLPRLGLQVRLKRLGDGVVSATLLLLTSPLVLLAGLLIWLQDRGPIFYSQWRSGLGGRPFRIWKLRTMRIDAERQGAQWVQQRDPRITPLGRLLRLTRIDELPQLVAVLRGEMSLIGPRPERPEFDLNLEQQIPHYRLRYWLRPGLSGWAQVNYPYGASLEDARNKLSFDLFYLRHFSFWLDLLILVKTMRLVFNARGALPQG